MNTFFAAILMISFFATISLTLNGSHFALIEASNWKGIWQAMPIATTAFGYAVVVPFIYVNSGYSVKNSKLDLQLGVGAVLLLYALWTYAIFSSISLKGLQIERHLVLK